MTNSMSSKSARELAELSFQIHATGGTFKRIEVEGIDVKPHYKLAEQTRPDAIIGIPVGSKGAIGRIGGIMI